MGVTTAMCNTFKTELLGGTHNLTGHSIKMALIKDSPTEDYGAATTTYNGSSTGNGTSLTQGTNDEATGTNYTTTGQVLDSASISLSGSTAIIDFTDEVFSNVTTSADGCLIYNDTATGDPAVCAVAFGGDKTVSSGTFTVQFPAAAATTAIVRIA